MTAMPVHDFTPIYPVLIFPLWLGIMADHGTHGPLQEFRPANAERTGNNRGAVRARASIDKALAAFNAALPRQGRIERQCKRAFIVSEGQPVSMRELRERWCYPATRRRSSTT
jgi:hypothetical protein